MTTFRDHLIKFIEALRTAGVRISVAESIDAMNAVAAAGLERERMREALAASLIKDEADREAFDRSFEAFFAIARRAPVEHPDQRGEQVSAASGRGRPGENRAPREESSPRYSEDPGAAADRESNEEPRSGETARKGKAAKSDRESPKPDSNDKRGVASKDETPHAESSKTGGDKTQSGIEATRLAGLRAIERLPFEEFSDLDYDKARDALAPLVRRFRIRMGRRLRLARLGRIDFRRTIRAGLQRGGALIDLKFRARRPRHVDLVILADVSGSVRYAAQLMLELIAGAGACFRRVASFVYVDHLSEAEFEQGHLVMTPPADLYARSDFGRVLGELWNRREGLLTRATVVVIMGDGRNNRLPARADVVREIARLCRAVIWLNPEEPARWGAGDSAIRQYAREVTALVPARNLRELQVGLLRIG